MQSGKVSNLAEIQDQGKVPDAGYQKDSRSHNRHGETSFRDVLHAKITACFKPVAEKPVNDKPLPCPFCRAPMCRWIPACSGFRVVAFFAVLGQVHARSFHFNAGAQTEDCLHNESDDYCATDRQCKSQADGFDLLPDQGLER
jgi:hypothetical protein